MKQSGVDIETVNKFDESLSEVSDSELQALEAESMVWVYLSEGAYLHEDKGESGLIQVVGIAQPSMNESNILWLI